jgi:class 3 adenylate cyclase
MSTILTRDVNATSKDIVGNMGFNKRFAYTYNGDSVNLASRVEEQVKYCRGRNVLGSITSLHTRDKMNRMTT